MAFGHVLLFYAVIKAFAVPLARTRSLFPAALAAEAGL